MSMSEEDLKRLFELAELAHKYGSIERHISPEDIAKVEERPRSVKIKFKKDPTPAEKEAFLHKMNNTYYGL